MTSTFAGRINLSLYFIFNANIVRAPDLLTTNVSILPQRQCYSNGPTRKRSTLWNRFIILVLCKSFLSQFWNKTVIQKMYSIMELPVILRVQVINPASQQMQCSPVFCISRHNLTPRNSMRRWSVKVKVRRQVPDGDRSANPWQTSPRHETTQ